MKYDPPQWKCEAAEFKRKSIVAFDVRMAEPRISAVDARLIDAAPRMFLLLQKYVENDPCAPNDPRYIEAQAILKSILTWEGK